MVNLAFYWFRHLTILFFNHTSEARIFFHYFIHSFLWSENHLYVGNSVLIFWCGVCRFGSFSLCKFNCFCLICFCFLSFLGNFQKLDLLMLFQLREVRTFKKFTCTLVSPLCVYIVTVCAEKCKMGCCINSPQNSCGKCRNLWVYSVFHWHFPSVCDRI